MGHLIKLEWLKMKNYTAFRVLAFLFAITLPLLLIAGKRIDTNVDAVLNMINSLYSFPTVFEVLAYAGSWLSFFFLGFLALLSVTNDYNHKTLRQNILTGLTRKEFILSKLLFVVTLCGIVTLYFIIIGSLFGFFNTPKIYFSDLTDSLPIFGKFYLMCLGYSVFGLLVGLVIKKTGLSLFLYIAYGMFLEPIFRFVFHRKIFGDFGIHYYPLNSFDELNTFPSMVRDKMEAIPEEWEGMQMFASSFGATIASLIYLGLFVFLLFFIINKRDL